MESTLDQLKEEATELGMTFSANIGTAKLQAKINEFKAEQDGPVAVKGPAAKKKAPAKLTKGQQIARAKKAANAKVVVTIIDNDQRVNNQTTSCRVNCSNKYFDLGQMTIPLNERVEVRQGHIDVLKEITIPHHGRDNKTGLSITTMRPRYSVVL